MIKEKRLTKMIKKWERANIKTKTDYYCVHCKIKPYCNMCVAHFEAGCVMYSPHKEPCEYYKPKNIFCRKNKPSKLHRRKDSDGMGDIVKLNCKKPVGQKKTETLFFFKQLDLLKRLYVSGDIDKIFILANGKSAKCCSGNRITIRVSKAMCRDFLENTSEYMDAKAPETI